jgi:peptidoglycan/LPS O-acetylase OafA/YrhL
MIVAAILVLFLHMAWIAFVIFGALWTRNRRWWTAFHVLSLLWGIAVEAGPWPCPLTLAEQYFESQAGWCAYRGSFLLHYLDAIVYPNFPAWLIGAAGICVCLLNLAIYGRRHRSRLAAIFTRPPAAG